VVDRLGGDHVVVVERHACSLVLVAVVDHVR